MLKSKNPKTVDWINLNFWETETSLFGSFDYVWRLTAGWWLGRWLTERDSLQEIDFNICDLKVARVDTLTTNRAMLLIASIATSISTRAHDRGASTSSVAALERAVSVAARRRKARWSLEWVCDYHVRSAEMRGLIGTVSTGDYCITELVLRQTLAGSARESVCRTSSRLAEIAVLFVFAVRTLSLAIAERRLRHAFSTSLALKSLLRTLRCSVDLFGHRKRAFFVRAVLEY